MPETLEDTQELLTAEPGKALPIDWEQVKQAMCVTGLTFEEASKTFRINHWSIRKRAERDEWPLPEKIQKRVQELAKNREITRIAAETWAEKGEKHRALAFKVASKALQVVNSAPPEVKDWADVERIDKMARRAAGLDTEEKSGGNALTINLVNGRMDLPGSVSSEYIQAEVQEISPPESLPE